jgi:hypothetical protein
VGGVLDGLHAGGEGGFDVFGAVVDEEDVSGWGLETFGGVAVDGWLGLGEVEGVRPGVVVEGFDPGMEGAETGLHGVGHVGEDADADAGALETLRPVDHGRVELAPVLDVGGYELVELVGCDFCPGGFVPEGFGFEVAAVVGVAVRPVSVVEVLFAEAGDGAHVGPGGKVGRAGEDHAVVEENCFYECHRVNGYCKGRAEFPEAQRLQYSQMCNRRIAADVTCVFISCAPEFGGKSLA